MSIKVDNVEFNRCDHFKYLDMAITENNDVAKEVAAQKFRRELSTITDLISHIHTPLN